MEMVEIAEIAADASRGEANPSAAEADGGAGTEPEKTAELPQEPGEPAAVPAGPVEAPAEDGIEPAAEPSRNQTEVAKTSSNDYALRVAYIMRSYLSIRPSTAGGGGAGAAAGGTSGDAAGDRCKAMMELVRMENGRWYVSKVILEHSHAISSHDPARGGILPTVGMDFESISMAKAFYIAYSEKMGFKAKTGSGKRSKGTRMLILQRFFCSRGNYLSNRNEEAAMKKKRGPYKKRILKKDGENVEVVQVESSDERTGEVGGLNQEKDGVLREKDVALPTELQGVVDTTKNGSLDGKDGGKEKVPIVGNPAQSRLLRELGIRVSKYTHEERRDIILRYMKKRNNRQVVDRSVKVIF